MVKRYFTIFMLLVGIAFPITKAFAFLPLIYLAYAAAASSELTPFIIGSATVVGTAIGLIRFSNTSNSAIMPINVTLDTSKPLATPTNWTAAPTGTQEPVPPNTDSPAANGTIPANIVDGTSHSFTGTSTSDLAAQMKAFLEASGGYTGIPIYLQYNSATQKMDLYEQDDYPNPTYYNYLHFNTTLTCKAGYTANSSGDCALTDATQVKKPSDNVCDYLKSSTGTFKASPNDPDCDTATVLGKNTSKLEYTTTTDHLIVTSDGDGRVTITQKSYDSSANKTSVSTASLSAAQVVTASTVSNVSGDTTGVDDSGTGSGGGSTSVTNFPNDYSRTGEAQSAANSTNAKLDTIHNDLTTVSNPADGNADLPDYNSGLEDTFSGLTSWHLPSHTSTCTTGSFEALGAIMTLDSQCTLMEQNKPAINVAMIVMWLLLALFIVLRA